jgi:hypothetical protein
MRVRQVSLAMIGLVLLAACGGAPADKTPGNKDDKSILPTVSAGTVLPDALTAVRCVREPNGRWRAGGTVKNTTSTKLDLDVRIHVGPADGKDGPGQVKRVSGVKPGASVDWTVLRVTADDQAGPCQVQVAVAK